MTKLITDTGVCFFLSQGTGFDATIVSARQALRISRWAVRMCYEAGRRGFFVENRRCRSGLPIVCRYVRGRLVCYTVLVTLDAEPIGLMQVGPESTRNGGLCVRALEFDGTIADSDFAHELSS